MVLAQPTLHIIPDIVKDASARLPSGIFSAMAVGAVTTLVFGFGCWVQPSRKRKLIKKKNGNDFMRTIYGVKVPINLKHFPPLLHKAMKIQSLKWIYLGILSIVWGSSYILIKWGLIALTPLQLGSLRLLITSVALLLVGFSSLKALSRYHWKWIIITGYVGTFFPAFLFAFAQQQINSGVAAILNALTPLLTLLFGLLFFHVKIQRKQFFGVVIGLMGSIGLVMGGMQAASNINPLYPIFIFLASCCYAINIHFIKRHLELVGVMAITVGNFICMMPAALVVLISSNFFTPQTFSHPEIYAAIGYITILALVGSAFAKYLFNKFIKITSAVFASSVTYTLPVVALFWGVYDGEIITQFQLLSAVIIFLGVYLSHKKKAA